MVVWAALLCLAFAWLVNTAVGFGNGTAGDRFSEANTLRAVDGFVVEGLGKTYGLPRIGFGGLYPEQGQVDKDDAYVYTHYPPGPEYIAVLLRIITGEMNVPLFRLVHVYLFFASVLFLSIRLAPVLGFFRLSVLIGALGAFPMTYNMSYGLHYQGIATTLLIFQIGVLVSVYQSGMMSRGRIFALLGIGFLQGYNNFDYAFLVLLAALPLAFVFTPQQRSISWRLVCLACLLPFVGFGAAHLLHFVQVVMLYGGLTPAINDLRDTARTRSFGLMAPTHVQVLRDALPNYILSHSRRDDALGAAAYVVAALSVLCMVPLSPRLPLLGVRWAFTARLRLGVVLSTLVCIAWVIAMPAHAAFHPHFVPRHLFLFVFVLLTAVLIGLNGRDARGPGVFMSSRLLQLSRALYVVPLVYLVIVNHSILPGNWASFDAGEFYVRYAMQPRERWSVLRAEASEVIGIGGVGYHRGLLVYAPSEIRISPKRSVRAFSGGCGVFQDNQPPSVRCRITQDGKTLWDSPIMVANDPVSRFSVEVHPGADIRLFVEGAVSESQVARAAWVDLQFQ